MNPDMLLNAHADAKAHVVELLDQETTELVRSTLIETFAEIDLPVTEDTIAAAMIGMLVLPLRTAVNFGMSGPAEYAAAWQAIHGVCGFGMGELLTDLVEERVHRLDPLIDGEDK